MTRPPSPPERSSFTEADDLAQFDATIDRGYKPQTYYGALLNAPQWGNAISNFAHLLRGSGYREGSYSHGDREWVDQILSYHWNYFGVLGSHTPDAISVGVRLEAIEALHEGREEEFTDDERLLADYIRQVTDGTVDEETWRRMLERLGSRGLVEYTMFIAHLLRVLRGFQALKIELPGVGSRDEVGAIIRGLRDGTTPVRELDDAVHGRYSDEEERAVRLDETARNLAHATGSTSEHAPANAVAAIMQSPALAAALAQGGLAARASANSYSEGDRRTIVDALSEHFGFRDLRRDEGQAPTGDSQVAEYARAFVDGTVTDAMYAELEERRGKRGAVEITACSGHTMVVLRLLQALRFAAG